MNRLLWPVLMLGMLLTGCRKDLCYGHHEHTPGVYLDVKAQWEQVWERDYGCDWKNHWQSQWGVAYEAFKPVVPTGLRLRTYQNGQPLEVLNLEPKGELVMLKQEGMYSFLFHNNDTEYIVYDGLSVSTRATATTRTVTRSGFRTLHEGERTINEPDMLYGKYVSEYEAIEKVGAEGMDITMHPLVYTYYIRFEFAKGFEHVVKASGAIAGMAEKVYLHDGHTGDEAATILYNCQLGKTGVEAKVMTFGVPNYPGDHYNRGDSELQPFMLNLEVLLKDGTTQAFDFDIADQMKNQPRGGVLVVKGIEVEMSEVSTGGGGFEVDVDDWGDIVDIPIPL